MLLIDRLKNGDIESLGLLVKECKAVCINHLLKKTNCDMDTAEDVFTEAIVDFGEKVVAGTVNDIKNLKGYMVGTCYNKWLSNYRKARRISEQEPDVERYFYDYMEPEEASAIEEMRELLHEVSGKALQMLSESCQSVIRYFYIEERDMKEIASLMGFASTEVARATKYKCFKKLREHVAGLERTIY